MPPRRIRTGSWSPPKPPISANLAKLLLPLAAIVPPSRSSFGGAKWKIRQSSSSRSALPRSRAGPRDDHEAAFAALLKSCRKRPARDDPACKAALRLGDKINRDAARRFFETNYRPASRRRGAARPRHRLLRARGERLARARRQVPNSRLSAARTISFSETGSLARALQRPATA